VANCLKFVERLANKTPTLEGDFHRGATIQREPKKPIYNACDALNQNENRYQFFWSSRPQNRILELLLPANVSKAKYDDSMTLIVLEDLPIASLSTSNIADPVFAGTGFVPNRNLLWAWFCRQAYGQWQAL